MQTMQASSSDWLLFTAAQWVGEGKKDTNIQGSWTL